MLQILSDHTKIKQDTFLTNVLSHNWLSDLCLEKWVVKMTIGFPDNFHTKSLCHINSYLPIIVYFVNKIVVSFYLPLKLGNTLVHKVVHLGTTFTSQNTYQGICVKNKIYTSVEVEIPYFCDQVIL